MTHINIMECVQGDTGCPKPTRHRVRVEDWERGPEAGDARFEALHQVLFTRREIQAYPDKTQLKEVLWGLVNVGRTAGQQWYTEEVAENLRGCATLLCLHISRRIRLMYRQVYDRGYFDGQNRKIPLTILEGK